MFFRAGFASDEQNNLTEHDFERIFSFYKELIFEKSGEYPSKKVQDVLEMYCHASVYMTVKWIMAKNRRTPEQLADLMMEAMPRVLVTLFTKLEILG